MKKSLVIAALALLAGNTFADAWKLGVQAYTFRKFTCCETLDQLSALGVQYVVCR